MRLKLRLSTFSSNAFFFPFAHVVSLEVPLEEYIHPGNSELTLSTSITQPPHDSSSRSSPFQPHQCCLLCCSLKRSLFSLPTFHESIFHKSLCSLLLWKLIPREGGNSYRMLLIGYFSRFLMQLDPSVWMMKITVCVLNLSFSICSPK